MAESNIEIVRASLAAWNEGDLERVSEFLDPEVELVPMRSLLDGSPYRGREGLLRFAADSGEE